MVEDEVSIFEPGGGGRRLALCLTSETDDAGELDPLCPVLQVGLHQARLRNTCRTLPLVRNPDRQKVGK